MNYTKMIHDGQVHMSPEGTEEKIVRGLMFFVTITEGGKFRSYGCATDSHRAHAGGSFDTFEEATVDMLQRGLQIMAMAAQDEGVPGVEVEELTEEEFKKRTGRGKAAH